jgi:hypothetical protein
MKTNALLSSIYSNGAGGSCSNNNHHITTGISQLQDIPPQHQLQYSNTNTSISNPKKINNINNNNNNNGVRGSREDFHSNYPLFNSNDSISISTVGTGGVSVIGKDVAGGGGSNATGGGGGGGDTLDYSKNRNRYFVI